MGVGDLFPPGAKAVIELVRTSGSLHDVALTFVLLIWPLHAWIEWVLWDQNRRHEKKSHRSRRA